MAARPIWRGHLRLALVSCPVALYSAKHERNAIRFNLINPQTGHRVRMVTLDAGTGDEVQRRDLVKGYEFKKDHYVLLTDEDFDSVKVESSGVMSIEKFVDVASVDPVYYDASYFLAPDGEAGKDVYAVVRQAIAQTGRMALSRVVISQRERVIALRPVEGGGLIAHTLHDARDLNEPKGLFEDVERIEVDPEMVKLATQLIDRQTGSYETSDFEDRYETRLRALIDAKLKGEGIEMDKASEPDRTNVVNIMDALKRSLGQATEKPSTPAKAPKVAKREKPSPEERPKPEKSAPRSGTPAQAAKTPRKRA